jgi:hypothetical protein
MSIQLWIGFGFLAFLVLFLIYSVVTPPKSGSNSSATIKFLTALCAGFAGGFLTGDALFSMSGMSGGFNYTVSGAAGCALFFTVWFFYPKVFQLAPGFEFGLPKDWTFRHAVDTMAETIGFTVDFQGFNDQELTSILQQRKISGRSVGEAISQLRLLTLTPGAIREYDLTESGSTYRLKIR